MVQKKGLRDAEKRYRALIEERDKFNQEAKLVREERDTLNQQKSALLAQLDELKAARNELVAKIKEHKKKRTEYQSKAKELIALRKEKRKKLLKGLPEELSNFRQGLESLELKQETTPLSLDEERKIIDRIKEMRAEVKKLEKILGEQGKLESEVININAIIDELFEKADKEHEEVVNLSEEAQKTYELIRPLFNEVASLINKAKKKHQEYIKLKQHADEFHKKALGLRATVIAFKKEARLRRELERKAIAEHKMMIEQKLTDKKEIEKFIDKSLEKLIKKGKVSLK